MSINIYKNGALQKVAGSAILDAQLDANSTNGVQNKVITAEINQINANFSEKIIATSTTTTRGADLLSLKTVFNALSDSDKRKLIIEHGVVIYHITKKNGLFEMTQTSSSNIFADQLDIENGTCGTFMTGIGGAQYVDQTTEPNTQPFILIRI